MSRIVQVEYAVRAIDEHGDCYDVDHREKWDRALADAVHLREEAKLDAASPCAAVVIEKETWHEDGDVDREIMLRMGDKKALREGGWL